LSEPTAKRADATNPAANRAAKAASSLARGSEASGDDVKAKNPLASAEVIPGKSSEVIAKSYRVRELPPPPVVTQPVAEAPQADELLDEAGRAVGVGVLEERELEPSIELDALDIRTKGTWSNLGRRVRMPARWEQWLNDPERRTGVGMSASLVVTLLLIALAGFVFKAPPRVQPPEILPTRTISSNDAPTLNQAARTVRPPEPIVRQMKAGELETVAIDPPEDAIAGDSNIKSHISPLGSTDAGYDQQSPASATMTSRPTNDAPPGLGNGTAGGPDLLQAADASMQGKFTRRTPDGRSDGVRYGGGSPQSEVAVERALHWLAAHQRPDGSWSFNHVGEACQHYCTNPGSEPSTTAATGMALLPFLGAGYTHKQGEYKDVIQRGLDYLKKRGILISYGNDLRDGSSMYGQALATIALCEAYGLTRDEELQIPAQRALDYICYAQDSKTGGWRYNPGEPGDTTVTGWMIMALKSGQMAKLNVQSPAIFGAQRFLDSVQNKDGSHYGYLDRKPRQGTTAVGLLCRMYTGWQRANPGLVKGAAQLAKWGPSKDNIYYDYYATQALFHYAGPEWDGWNRKMRELLIKSQDIAGHAAGSWYFESPPHTTVGGRLYNTAMATMILEVYYRFMPLYGEDAIK
jgi:hypothetical protein